MQILSLSVKRAAWIAVILGLATLISAFGVTNPAAQGSEGLISACRHNRTGAIVIVEMNSSCEPEWSPISWNIKGEQGPQGAPGSVGPQGSAGDSHWQLSGSATYYSVGNVGIGTNKPGMPLEVRTAQSSSPAIRFGDPNGFGQLVAGSSAVVIATEDGKFRLWIDQSTGNVGIGTTAPASKLDVAGLIQATNFPGPSDVRFKTNIIQLTDVLQKLEQIQGVSFDWNELYKSMGRATGHRELGVIAQEVEVVYPELITTWGDENYRAVDYGRLTVVLIEAIKELRAEKDVQISTLRSENVALQAEVTDLHRQINDLEARLTALEQRSETLPTMDK